MTQIFADLRCLQDPEYRGRGVGHLTRTLMRRAHEFAPRAAEMIGLVDPEMEGLSEEDRALVSRVDDACRAPDRPCIFIQPSPMTHAQHRLLPMMRSDNSVKATVVYDFIPFDEPAHYLHSMEERMGYHTALFWLGAFDLFFPISDYSASRLASVLGVTGDRVVTIGAPIRTELLRAGAASTPSSADRLGESEVPYFLVIGGDDWRKNVECPIAAFDRLLRATQKMARLIIVGNYSSARQNQLLSGIPTGSPIRKRIRFLGGLSDTELARLYSGALATICPSRIEGFSLPVVEAVACGSPVLASDCAAQAELIADRDALFPAEDPGRLASLMTVLLNEPHRRSILWKSQGGLAARFADRAVSERFWRKIFDAYASAARATPAISRGSRPRLAFVTPYPPDASGVADYTARSLIDIAHHADVDLFTDAVDPRVHPAIRFAGPICSLPYFSRGYDRVVSIVGNSDFHTRIIDYVRDFGGACIEHDNRLADFYFHIQGYEQFAGLAARKLGRSVSREEAEAGLLDPEVFKSLFFDEIVYSAQPFIVHSRGIQQNVKAIYGVQAEYLPFCPYREFRDEELRDAARSAARQRLGIEPGKLAIATFGSLAPTKANVECIWALEQLRAWRFDAELYFVGEANRYVKHLRRVIRKLELDPFVHFMKGNASESIYRDFLLAADVNIQLRTHRLGGLSGTLLDAIVAGLPAVANRDLAAAMDAPDYVRRIPDQISPILIAEQIAELMDAGRHRVRVGPERVGYVERHSFSLYARQLMAVLGLEIVKRAA